MLLRKLSLLLVLCCSVLSVSAAGIEFFHGSWEEALAKATAEDKLIFVDAYTTWCGPCKRMSANVFPQDAVGEVFNKNFINLKLDMEKQESLSFRKVHRVAAYPTLFWINGQNEVVHKSVGGKQVKSLISVAEAAIAKQDDLPALRASWEAEAQTPAAAFRYVRALVRNGEPHLRVTNDYLRGQRDLTTPDHLNLLLVAATDADSRVFDLLVANRSAAVALVGEETYDATVTRAIMTTKDKALEFKDEKLLATAVAKMKSVDPAAAKALGLQGEFELAARGNSEKDMLKATKNYLKKGVNGEAARQSGVYKTVIGSKFAGNEKILRSAVDAEAAAAAAAGDGGFQQYYRLADYLLKHDRADWALPYARLAVERVPDNKANYKRAATNLLEKVEAAQ